MEPEARYTLVGTVVIVLVVAMAGTLVWLAASGQHKETRNFRVYFANQSLEGLEIRSDVRMKGIRVGAVSGFAFAKNRPGTVEVDIAIDPETPVLQSTRAVVDRNLITSVATIRLLNMDETSPPLALDPGGAVTVIAEGSTELQQITATVDQLAQRADETLRRVNATLSDENQAAIGQTLNNMRVLTRNANELAGRLDKTLGSVEGAADTIRTSVSSITGDVHRLADRYDGLGATTTTSVVQVTESARRLALDVERLSARSEGLIVDSDVELRMTGQQLRTATDAITRAARSLENPRATLLGPGPESLGPGERR